MHRLGRNLGFTTERISGHKSNKDFSSKQRLAWDKAREAIDNDFHCYDFDLHVPENYIIYGYDDKVGYYFKCLRDTSCSGIKPWKDLGLTDVGWLEINIIKPCEVSSDKKTIKDALVFAIEFSKNSPQYMHPGFKAGLSGYDLWIDALRKGKANADGVAYSAAAWSECRKYAVGFLEEAKSKLPDEFDSLLSGAINHYRLVHENLNNVSMEFPYYNTTIKQIQENIEDEERCLRTIQYLKAAREEEKAGLFILERIVNKL